MSAISGYGDSYAAYDYEPPPGSDNPVENAGPLPPPQQSSPPAGDTSYKDWGGRVEGTIINNITKGNYADDTVLTDIG